MKVEGIWLPIITPFKDGEVDFESYKMLINYYIDKGISGLIPLGTTGESPTISEYEYENIIEKTLEYNDNRVPVYVGVGGNDTNKVIKLLKRVEKHKVDGVLSVCPYYNRPSQKGIYEHFLGMSESTELNILIYNIPYRTGRNIENSTIFKLAELKNVVGIKDSSGDIKQSLELLLNKPDKFSVLTGEDILFYTTLTNGGDGGILASSHIQIDKFLDVYKMIKGNNHEAALETWRDLSQFIPLLFDEPNPAPLKYCLKKLGLIQSSEIRRPLVEISDKLEEKLNKFLDRSKF